MQSDGVKRDSDVEYYKRWSSTNGFMPEWCLEGGYEADGKILYVVAAYVDGTFTPGKYGHHLSGACIPYHHEERVCEKWYRISGEVSNRPWIYSWEHASNGNVPRNALRADEEMPSEGEGLYIGRVHHAGSLIPCKVHRTHRCAYFGYDGKEHKSTEYEVLVCTLKSGQPREGEEGEGQKEVKE
ncbi:uncharacterized protein LOC134263213 [Saccostrea cucullata]|uniref:uncharacterized protein LOC134263213 n=1 Tax=Saccostrea cuccullata TaxID=36930 RepID=UPI002ED3DE47